MHFSTFKYFILISKNGGIKMATDCFDLYTQKIYFQFHFDSEQERFPISLCFTHIYKRTLSTNFYSPKIILGNYYIWFANGLYHGRCLIFLKHNIVLLRTGKKLHSFSKNPSLWKVYFGLWEGQINKNRLCRIPLRAASFVYLRH